MSSSRVLVLARASDAHAGALAWALARNGVETLWTPSLRPTAQARVSLLADADGVRVAGLGPAFRSAWYRTPQAPPFADCAPEDRDFVATQWRHFQQNAFDAAAEALAPFWVNAPRAAEAAESKLLQLRAAHAVGMRFPELAASNDLDAVRRLRERCGTLVFKPFHAHLWRSRGSGEVRASGVVLLDEHAALPEAAIALCPGLYQRYIDKTCDVRVTAIGGRWYAARLRRANGSAYLDWRPHVCDADFAADEIALPAALEERLRALMQTLGLSFGAIDLVVDRAGEFHFLEVNQRGQFLFVEQLLPALPLLRAMTAMLLAARSDYALDASCDVRFADYVQSDDYRRLREAPPEASDTLTDEG